MSAPRRCSHAPRGRTTGAMTARSRQLPDAGDAGFRHQRCRAPARQGPRFRRLGATAGQWLVTHGQVRRRVRQSLANLCRHWNRAVHVATTVGKSNLRTDTTTITTARRDLRPPCRQNRVRQKSPVRVIFDRVQRGLPIGPFHLSPESVRVADIPDRQVRAKTRLTHRSERLARCCCASAPAWRSTSTGPPWSYVGAYWTRGLS